ncbi:MAG: class I SAM-dependent methyltransferase [Cyanobacteria bacterium P01_F01_bin.150]
MTTQSLAPLFDDSRVDALSKQLTNVFNNSALSLMVSIGHRTRLFDVLALLPPATSEQVAHAAGLQERYVRGWLNVMVVGNVLDYSPTDKTYHLPAEHAVLLTRAATTTNMAAIAQYIPVLASAEDQIVQYFAEGSDVLHGEIHRFNEVVAEDNAQRVVAALEDHILPLVPNVLDDLTLGIDVLHAECGRGHILNSLAQLFPNSQFTGYDLNEDAIAFATQTAQYQQLQNVQFQVKDSTRLEDVEKYDLITTFDTVHSQARPDWLLRNIYNALRPNGVYIMQEIHAASDVSENLNHPLAPLLYTVSCMRSMAISPWEGKTNASATGDLGEFIWGRERTLNMLENAGFTHIEIEQLPYDVINDYYIARK